ncbi:hypothetical protein MLD38_028005 [Melastoma candidum]|uniref:Uncharacterized protein n=1 Tax=Melastoma candidum TaxID=119954 RepID=A0ACB9MZT2_9MYRT|nr:hypothetical protein MLD38_028005 [Melastoma candidum]
MGCINSKQAVTVTPAFDHSGQFKDKAGCVVPGKGRNVGSGRVDLGRVDSGCGRVGRTEHEERKHTAGKDGGADCNAVVMESVSFRLGNLHKYVEGEQVAAGWPAWLSAVAGEAIQGWVPLRSDAFEKLEKIGQGTYSSVFRARELDSGKIVALKKVRFDNFDPESVRFMAREIHILRRLHHPNIMKLEGLIASRLSSSIYLVFEYMEHDVTGLLSCPDIKFSEAQMKCYMKQLLSGLDHCHSRGVMHRDIKGSNLLVSNEGILKLADFGLANYCCPSSKQPLTSRVVTLWYRPPELLLGSTDYGASVDLWSVGCVFAEILLGRPILQGRTEVEQLHKIFKLCGSPAEDYWKRTRLPHSTLFKPQQPYDSCLRESFRELPSDAVDLIETLLSVEPNKRGTAASALSSQYFKNRPHACDPSSLPVYPPSKEIDAKNREATRRKKVNGRSRGPDAARKPLRKSYGSSMLAAGEDFRYQNKRTDRAEDTASNLQTRWEAKTMAGCEAPKPSLDLLEETSHVKNTSRGDIPFSGPLQVSSSSGFAWAKRQKDEASARSHVRSISRSQIVFEPSNVLQCRDNNIQSRRHENGSLNLPPASRTNSRDRNPSFPWHFTKKRTWFQREITWTIMLKETRSSSQGHYRVSQIRLTNSWRSTKGMSVRQSGDRGFKGLRNRGYDAIPTLGETRLPIHLFMGYFCQISPTSKEESGQTWSDIGDICHYLYE